VAWAHMAPGTWTAALRPTLTGTQSTLATTLDATNTPSLPEAYDAGAPLPRELLEVALDRLSARGDTFGGRYELLGPMHRRSGGQGVVQFARACHSGEGVAIKFFLNRAAFDCEEELCLRRDLCACMPDIAAVERNDDVRRCGHACSPCMPDIAAAKRSDAGVLRSAGMHAHHACDDAPRTCRWPQSPSRAGAFRRSSWWRGGKAWTSGRQGSSPTLPPSCRWAPHLVRPH
jgi:hypothetical protein